VAAVDTGMAANRSKHNESGNVDGSQADAAACISGDTVTTQHRAGQTPYGRLKGFRLSVRDPRPRGR
jgi:hypothetical protein